jgi:tetratricopeptide (TPR) repeat protein
LTLGNADDPHRAEAALAMQPRDWRLLGEIAEFLIRQVADYESALKLGRVALERNPWSSVWLWNVLGDALFSLDRYGEAHEAYLRAQAIDGADARTHLNLAYTHAQAGSHAEALDAIARGLASDRAGALRAPA